MDEVMGIVCGAMFGEERVNNSVDVLSRDPRDFQGSFPGIHDRLFSWSNFRVSYSYTLLLQRSVTDV